MQPGSGKQPRRLLVVAYKFPDVILPGGSVRVEKFLKYLPRRWQPTVLSVKVPEEALVEAVHRGPDVHRTGSHYGIFAKAYRTMHLEQASTARKRGIDCVRRLKNLFLVPDDAVLWWPRAWPLARRLVRERCIDLVFSSGPPFSCLLLGALIARRSKIPLVADLRDDWAGNPLAGIRNLTQRVTEFRMERWMVETSARVVHATEASLKLYERRYPQAGERMSLIRNGYDEADFRGWDALAPEEDSFAIVHTGSLREGRDPGPFLKALALLRERGRGFERVTFRQVGTTHQEYVRLAAQLGLEAQVSWTPRLERQEALAVVGRARGLLLLPTQSADTAIPGKAYEYLRAGKPILVISKANESTRFLSGFDGVTILPPEDVPGIAEVVASWLENRDPPRPDLEQVKSFSRETQARQLAELFDRVVDARYPPERS